MTVKEFLGQAKLVDAMIEAKTEQMQRLMALLTSGVAKYGDAPRGGGGDRADITCKLADLEREISADLDILIATKRAIAVAIDGVEGETHRTVLELRYLYGWPFDKIAGKLSYGRTKIWEIHEEALSRVVVPRDIC